MGRVVSSLSFFCLFMPFYAFLCLFMLFLRFCAFAERTLPRERQDQLWIKFVWTRALNLFLRRPQQVVAEMLRVRADDSQAPKNEKQKKAEKGTKRQRKAQKGRKPHNAAGSLQLACSAVSCYSVHLQMGIPRRERIHFGWNWTALEYRKGSGCVLSRLFLPFSAFFCVFMLFSAFLCFCG